MTFVDKANSYARAVIERRIPTCKYVIQACERQESDLVRQGTKEFPYRFDADKAERICKFISLLPHIKGRWAREGKTISLEPWQCFGLTTVFGWVHMDTGLRRFRTVYEEVPRKNAKSTKVAGVGLYLLVADDEAGSEVYSAATTRDQARIVWSDAKAMVEKTKGIRERFGVETSARSIFVDESNSKFLPLSRDQGGNLDGLNVHGGIIDEVHAHKTRDIYDVIETATGSRDQSLLFLITTAGFNRAGICYEQRMYTTRILSGQVEDESYFGIIYTVDDEEREDIGRLLSDPLLWQKANPNWGVSVSPEDIERKARKAREMTAAQNNFLTKHLNVWVNADSAWLDMAKLQRCADPELAIDDFLGERCYGGLDLASKLDIASRGELFVREGHFYWFDRHYLPEETIETSTNSQYEGWARDGFLIETPGNVIDYDWIEDDIRESASKYTIEQYGFDPYQAQQLVSHLLESRIQMVQVSPGVKNFSEPMKELEKLIVAEKFHYNGNPVMTWMFSNVVCHTDAKDNLYPRKETPENKIDGVIALLTALNLALVNETTTSIYETEDILVL